MRFAVIGCGWITGAVHAPAYECYMKDHPEVKPAACCDIDAGKAETVRARFGFERAWDNAERMLAEEKLDAVCLNVPPAITCELGCRVLRRGLALLCEKPPGQTPEELERLITAAEEGKAAHMVAFNRRWMPLVRELRQRLDNRQVEHIQYTLSRVGRKDSDFGITAVHAVDAVRFLANSDYRHVHIRYHELPEIGEGVANYALSAEMVNGALAEIALTPLAGTAVERALVSARGWSADLRMPVGAADRDGRLLVSVDGRLEAESGGIQTAGGEEEWRLSGFYQEDAAFFDALRAGRRPPDGLETAQQSVTIMRAMKERQSRVEFA